MKNSARALSLIGAGVVAGGIIAGTLSANAATSGTTAASSAPSSAGSGSSSAPADDLGSTPVRSDEKAVDSSLAASLTEKAQAKTGGTVYRVESDAGDGTYEAHVKKSDGTLVTVKFDGSGTITAVEDGMGTGDPAPSGGRTGG